MRKQLWVTIGVTSVSQALKDAGAIFESGADGIFLSAKGVELTSIPEIYSLARGRVGENQFVGVKLVDVQEAISVGLLPGLSPSALWLENVGYVPLQAQDVSKSISGLKNTRHRLAHHGFTGMLLGEVEPDSRTEFGFAIVATLVNPYLDGLVVNVCDVSGMSALMQIRSRAADMKVVLAGQFTPENLPPYLEFADSVIVGESVTRTDGRPEGYRIRMLSQMLG